MTTSGPRIFTDGKEMEECPECNGTGDTICSQCGNPDGQCKTCNGTGEIEKGTQ